MACRTGDVLVNLPDGTSRLHGRLSWSFAQALLNTPPNSNWIQILAEMERLIQMQGWEQPLMFCGQPTQRFL